MSWNDGASKQLNGWLDKLIENLDEETIGAFKEVIDEKKDIFERTILDNIPQSENGGNLKKSFTISEITDRGSLFYGYRASFEGNAPNGEPYQKIANILNYGSEVRKTKKGKGRGLIKPTLFITRSIKKLKGMNVIINQRINKVLDGRAGVTNSNESEFEKPIQY